MKKLILLAFIILISVRVKAQYPAVSISNIVASCNFSGSAQANVSGGIPPYTYEWYSMSSGNNTVATTALLSNVDGGYYWVKVTDSNGNYDYTSVTIPGPFQINVTNVTNAVCPLSNGSATYAVNGGTAPYDAQWSHGLVQNGVNGTVFTANGLGEGMYYITVTDANGCAHTSQSDSGAYVNSLATFYINVTKTPSNCHDGTLTANVSGSSVGPLTYYWNTFPPQTTQTAIGLDPNFYYTVMVTDANGCSASGYETADPGPNALDLYLNATQPTCPLNNGEIMAYANYGQSPYTYQWSTGATTQGISGLAPGSYSITIMDAAGCSVTKQAILYSSYGFSANYTSVQTACDNISGSATITPTGGTPPYTYLWSNGATTQTATGLSNGYYHADVADVNGCLCQSSSTYVGINPSCFASIEGRVFNDINANCVLDQNETELTGQIISLGNGQYTSTGYSGQYFVSSLTPQTYTVNHTPMQNWNPICPASGYTLSPAIGQVLSGNHFYDQPVSLQNDVIVNVEGGLPRPGFSYTKSFSVYNNGSNTANGTVTIQHDMNEVYNGSSMYGVVAYDQSSRTITIAYDHLAPFTYRFGTLNFSLPTSVPLGTIISTTGIADPVAGDNNPSDNYDTSLVTVVGSYDPNEKEVSPKGIGAGGLIPANNEYAEYTVHFQNTGTFYAETVAITDTLDEDLDVNTLQVISSSHNLNWRLTGPGVLILEFNNIYLPDSLSDEPGSHGFVTYRIKQKPNLTGGTEINNTAYIYFDYNAPIVTNTTLNTIQILGIKENASEAAFVISPNPAQDKISIESLRGETCEVIELIDINGRWVATIKPTSEVIQLPELANGVYIVKATYKSGEYRKKLIISK